MTFGFDKNPWYSVVTHDLVYVPKDFIVGNAKFSSGEKKPVVVYLVCTS